ncbi:MAG TPA: hypothetical protein VNM43_01975 [Dehalococcoidia bacterium]|nr:hypothetical protein [Dehalococcoidia bacterium]
MRTEIWESDPFSAKKSDLLATVDTDYRFEKGDELYIDSGGKTMKVRIMHVWVHVKNGNQLTRDVLALKI